jgi:2-amino-4-hydroxy-6-hydroxymethyldihydropteridine diphosphokinase
VSAIYETPAWGFESDDFYNCAIVVHTCKTAPELLDNLLKAEAMAGRLRNDGAGYSARSIDIDIIAFNDEVIDEHHLHVPHPRMTERNFVLYPLRDVAQGWIHPVSGKEIDELIAASPDASPCKNVGTLAPFLESKKFRELNYIAIEGNIGAGKTSLSSKLSEDFNARLVQERFADNPFLPLFYQDQARYAFSLEMSFLADRYQQLTDDLAQFELFSDFVVADYYIVKSLIFSRITLSDEEYKLYQRVFDIMYKEIPKPGLYIYLYQNTERLLANIRKRGRDYEQDIKADYLNKLNKGYLDFIKSQQGLNVLVLDVTDKDFVNCQEDYIWMLNEISVKLSQND